MLDGVVEVEELSGELSCVVNAIGPPSHTDGESFRDNKSRYGTLYVEGKNNNS
ncbi:hypothetical protein HAX54_041613 [Datura stramonium]|uniref:Uncharacterized protein n=1 Tax=Datura stramonium TaxID=4076 RepID=A0ABS8SLE6_DATST|nr:hypothetical protein [Datura stramonium]